jgi:hypothetical protein
MAALPRAISAMVGDPKRLFRQHRSNPDFPSWGRTSASANFYCPDGRIRSSYEREHDWKENLLQDHGGPRISSSVWIVHIGIEKLLPIDFIASDRALSLRRNQPVKKRWPASAFTAGCLAGFTSITPYWLNRRLSPSTRMGEVAAILERQPCAAIGKHVGVRS